MRHYQNHLMQLPLMFLNAFTIEKLEFPILVKVIPDGEPTAENKPSLIASLFVFDDVKLNVPSIVIEYFVLFTPCNTE